MAALLSRKVETERKKLPLEGSAAAPRVQGEFSFLEHVENRTVEQGRKAHLSHPKRSGSASLLADGAR